MKKLLSFIGFTAAAVVSSTVVYLYMNDREVRNKVDAAIASVGDAVREVKRGIETERGAKADKVGDPVARNQAWADEQWEALGI